MKIRKIIKRSINKGIHNLTQEVLGRWYGSPLTFSETRRQIYGFTVGPKEISKARLYNVVHKAYKQGWIEKKKIHDKMYYIVTKQGRIQHTIYRLKTYTRKKGAQPTIVMFDIPEEKRSYRGFIRRLLKQMDFTMLQRSVFITPNVLPKVFFDLLREMKILQHFLFIEGRVNFKI